MTTTTNAFSRNYVKPSLIRIDRGARSERLYSLERKRNDIITECAGEWARLLDVPQERFWSRSLPQALFDTLSSWDRRGAELAAVAFLESRGYTVAKPDEE